MWFMVRSRPVVSVGGGERAEDLLWLPGHVRVRGAVLMLEDRVGGEPGELCAELT
jgi:hypothetical protein